MLTDNFFPIDYNGRVNKFFGIRLEGESRIATRNDTILLNYLKYNGINEIQRFYSQYMHNIPLSYYIFYKDNNKKDKLFYACTLYNVIMSQMTNDPCDLCCVDDNYFKYLWAERNDKLTFVKTKIQNL